MVELFSKSSWCPEATPLVALRGVRNTRVKLVQVSSSGAFRGKLTVCRYRKNLPVGDFSAACTETACIRTAAPKPLCCPYRFLVIYAVSHKGLCSPACAGALSCGSIETALLPLSFLVFCDMSQKGICFPACAGALSCDSTETALLPRTIFIFIVKCHRGVAPVPLPPFEKGGRKLLFVSQGSLLRTG